MKNDYSSIETMEVPYEHVDTVEEAKCFLQTYGEIMDKASKEAETSGKAGIMFMCIIMLIAFAVSLSAHGSRLIFTMAAILLASFIAKYVDMLNKAKNIAKLANEYRDAASSENHPYDELILTANCAIDDYNGQVKQRASQKEWKQRDVKELLKKYGILLLIPAIAFGLFGGSVMMENNQKKNESFTNGVYTVGGILYSVPRCFVDATGTRGSNHLTLYAETEERLSMLFMGSYAVSDDSPLDNTEALLDDEFRKFYEDDVENAVSEQEENRFIQDAHSTKLADYPAKMYQYPDNIDGVEGLVTITMAYDRMTERIHVCALRQSEQAKNDYSDIYGKVIESAQKPRNDSWKDRDSS